MTTASFPDPSSTHQAPAPSLLRSRLAIAEVHSAFLWMMVRSLVGPQRPQARQRPEHSPADGWLEGVLSLILLAIDLD